ncbi:MULTISPECIES: DNA adenine methylase [Mesorhizobium]|uniref:site-specific DNA-methyltransferase (adenine-specific) n=4 Tax=Mesorhizobium TaxID=68287 RepID=Q8KJ92_RHILI|nr:MULTISPECIES: DNA adenine methylase [Mesorhizobium]MBZ9909446.1 DNA adenine methylase [Mesorhizobium sp. BR115XR7A]QGX80693.1 DNA adenine methylase [Mesorhizobium japonicum R7A]QJF04841.1 DNA adenine methylase [Mesorhizobium japonicum R7A]QJF10910.1 DNA adenine methylase [Mesorhizobium japonicum]QJI86783.1 DNA adenine methylase [Mesorhizobium japonicum]
MPLATSPLRYPGGKAPLTGLVSQIIRLNKLQYGHYAEPYAGGCGLALGLLYGGYVSDIHINDIDRGIWAFWNVVLNQTDDFIDLMNRTPVTLDEWRRRREMQRNQRGLSPLEIAFTTFFLNRTNRSGIIKNAGVIGGLGQVGDYKIDCRFTKSELERRIRRVQRYRDHIHLHRKDALDFLKHVERNLPERTFLCIDPPYFKKGSTLYTSFYDPEDHAAVATKILGLDRPWIITYDRCDEISALYKTRRQYEISLNYSAQVKRVGSELLVVSKGLKVPDELRDAQVHKPQYRSAA